MPLDGCRDTWQNVGMLYNGMDVDPEPDPKGAGPRCATTGRFLPRTAAYDIDEHGREWIQCPEHGWEQWGG
jgi:hypothetical protein